MCSQTMTLYLLVACWRLHTYMFQINLQFDNFLTLTEGSKGFLFFLFFVLFHSNCVCALQLIFVSQHYYWVDLIKVEIYFLKTFP